MRKTIKQKVTCQDKQLYLVLKVKYALHNMPWSNKKERLAQPACTFHTTVSRTALALATVHVVYSTEKGSVLVKDGLIQQKSNMFIINFLLFPSDRSWVSTGQDKKKYPAVKIAGNFFCR